MEGIGERNRGLFIIKSRGMGHSNQIREFVISNKGIKLLDVELGPNGILTGAARKANELRKKISALKLQSELNKKDREIIRKKRSLEANISSLKTEFESLEEELNILHSEEETQAKLVSGHITNKLNMSNGKRKS
jgi:circadian clock protein KaiC